MLLNSRRARLWISVAVLGALRATSAASPPERAEFWSGVASPHAAEVRELLTKVERHLRAFDERQSLADYSDQGAVDSAARAVLLATCLELLQRARRLDPDNVEVLQAYAYLAEDSGQVALAIPVLEEYLARELPEQRPAEAYLRLGRLYARRGRVGDAIAALKEGLAQRPGGQFRDHTLLSLASLYMHLGRMNDAISLLSQPPGAQGQSPTRAIVAFSLAVAYDRDEQISRAHAILNDLLSHHPKPDAFIRMLSPLGPTFALVHTPAADRHYFNALLFEAAGYLNEARGEWHSYASCGDDVPYRARARAHIEAIDALLVQPRGLP